MQHSNSQLGQHLQVCSRTVFLLLVLGLLLVLLLGGLPDRCPARLHVGRQCLQIHVALGHGAVQVVLELSVESLLGAPPPLGVLNAFPLSPFQPLQPAVTPPRCLLKVLDSVERLVQ